VFEICVTKFFQSLALIFDPSRSSKVKSDGVSRKPVGPMYKCCLGSNFISGTVFEIFRVKILTVDLLTLAGLTPGSKFTKGEMTYYPPRSTIVHNFSTIAQTSGLRDMRYQSFSLFGLGGLTPGPKFSKREMTWWTPEIYYPTKFHRSTPTHA